MRLDADSFAAAIRNIIDNAVTYTPSGGSVKVTLARGPGAVELKVADTGVGIPLEDQPRIFDKFFRAKNALKMDTDGNGFGLFIAKNIIEAHGGTITFTSELNKGSEFVIRLPIEEKLKVKSEK
jgi:signal transduction histidine kinase